MKKENYMSEEEWFEYFKEDIQEPPLSLERGSEKDFIDANHGKIHKLK